MSNQERDQILRDNWDGHTYSELAELTGWNAESVRKWGSRNKMPHKKLNVQTRPRKGEVDLGKLKALIKKNKLSVVEVANYFDCSPAKAKEAILRLQAGHTVLEVLDDKVSLRFRPSDNRPALRHRQQEVQGDGVRYRLHG